VLDFWIMWTCSSFGLLINAGVVSFYKDFLESLYELLGGSASVTGIYLQMFPFCYEFWDMILTLIGIIFFFLGPLTAIGHISHTEKVLAFVSVCFSF